jgi:FKBP-type peptidyl-prolyl cis-trans isomerase FkpA
MPGKDSRGFKSKVHGMKFILAASLFGLAAASTAASAAAGESGNQIIGLPLYPTVPQAFRACSQKTASGLGYNVLRSAQGARPGQGDVVLVTYIGYLAANGRAFNQAVSVPIPVEGLIEGLAEGMKLLPKGGIYRFCVPSALGYGDKASATIPANSDLVFQVELLDFRSRAEFDAMQRQSGAAKP